MLAGFTLLAVSIYLRSACRAGTDPGDATVPFLRFLVER